MQSYAFHNFSRLLLKVPEHTWWVHGCFLVCMVLHVCKGFMPCGTCDGRVGGGTPSSQQHHHSGRQPHHHTGRGIAFGQYFHDATNYTNAYLHEQLARASELENYHVGAMRVQP